MPFCMKRKETDMTYLPVRYSAEKWSNDCSALIAHMLLSCVTDFLYSTVFSVKEIVSQTD